jgi:hypothetical protein
MKKLFLLVFALGIMAQGFSQITLEHSYYIFHADIYMIDLGNNDYKYVIQDSTGFRLFNLDHSPYLTVVPPIPIFQPPSYYEVSYISKTLFDCDSTNIEYVITRGNHPSNFYVYRTDGTLLFERDSVTGTYAVPEFDGSFIQQPIVNTPNGAKLFLQPNGTVEIDSEYIYSLCGTLPASISEIPIDNRFVEIFPNPTTGIINFQIKQPNNHDKFKLTIYDSSFQRIEESDLNVSNYQIDLTKHSLSASTYFFDLRTQNKVYQTGKFIITK